MKENTKKKLRSLWRAVSNPHLLISVGLAWFITNGWSYCFFGFGMYFGIKWMYRIGAFWMGMLWLPGTPEKLVTFIIAIWLLERLFPDDTRTLAKIKKKRREVHEATKLEFEKIRAKFSKKKRRNDAAEEVRPEDTASAEPSEPEQKDSEQDT
ncbi:MAG: hypothetical protein IKQ39_07615 [Oscillospiraceae bacterium]|nr:hypothetical protein [Oscillospiraceae bacterium]